MNIHILFWRLLGWVVGLLDYGFLFLQLLGSKRPKFFRFGYGDVAVYEKRFQQTLAALDNGSYSFRLTEQNIDWGRVTRERDVTIQEAHFLSPLAEILSKESAYCQFYVVKPISFDNRDDNKEQGPPTYVVMLPATGETDIRIRIRIARQLARTYGWHSVIVTAPYYGCRKPEDQTLFLINSVKDILLQSQAVIEEAVAICQYLLKKVDRLPKSPPSKPRICFTGFSYGAAMAACASTFALKAGVDGDSLSCAAYVGSTSPNVLADGILESGIHWDALRKGAYENQEDTRKRLFDFFDSTQLITVKPPKTVTPLRAIKAYSMTNDLFIRPRYSKILEQQVQECLNPNFRMEWLPGGHVSAALMRHIMQKKLIVDTITSMQ